MSKTVENVDQVKELVHKNRIITICEAAAFWEFYLGQRILRDNLKVHWIAAKFVPIVLYEGQKEIAFVLGTVSFYN